MSVVEIAAAVRAGRKPARTFVDESLERIARLDPKVNAFVHIDADGARRQAAAIDARVARGEDPGPLAGVPFGVKDMRETVAGMPRRDGSVFNRDNPPDPKDSTAIARLRAAGAIVVGKVATAEFGMDGVTHTRLHGTTRNPWNLSRSPGGSSGGSAAAVAAGLVPFCTASDAGGSTRCPAGYTGTVGLKPSHGRIPRPDGFSDRGMGGAITATVADHARILDVLSGPDDLDRMSLPAPGLRYEDAIETLATKGLKAAYSPDFGFAPVEPQVEKVTRAAARKLADAAGLSLSEPAVRFTNVYPSSNLLMVRMFLDELADRGIWPARADELSPGPRQIAEQSRNATQHDLLVARGKEKQLAIEAAQFFAEYDVLLSPCHGCTAYPAEGPLAEVIDGRDARETNGDPFTMLANIAWNPSISVPAGIAADGLPVGLLITVRRHRDDVALRLARILEVAQPWPRVAPGY